MNFFVCRINTYYLYVRSKFSEYSTLNIIDSTLIIFDFCYYYKNVRVHKTSCSLKRLVLI